MTVYNSNLNGMLPVSRTLPHDVTRLIFEFAAQEDKRMALKLALVSSVVQRWIDLILYSTVNLHRQSTTQAFLRTIETSKIKNRAFFATHVKSLCVSFDSCNEHTVKIISTCTGVTNLTFWVVPITHPPLHICTYPATSSIQCRHPSHNGLVAALHALRPRRLSVLLHDALCSPNRPHHPQFHLPFFERITHLAIVNRWHEWCSWSGFHLLPSLTHLSLDCGIGPGVLDDRWGMAIARAVGMVLERCPKLVVCVLVLLFDSHPTLSVGAIMKHVVRRDARLVFLRDTEPFRYREAHSRKEEEAWELAEGIVAKQRCGFEHTFFEILFPYCRSS